jgi:hypothetical protein
MPGMAPRTWPDGATLPSRKVTATGKKVPSMGDDNKIHHGYERVVVSGEGATAREIRIYGSGGRLIFEGWQVADDGGQTAWISDAAAIAVFGQLLDPGETADAGPLWLFDNFAEVKEMGSCSPPFMAEVAKALGERYEPA